VPSSPRTEEAPPVVQSDLVDQCPDAVESVFVDRVSEKRVDDRRWWFESTAIILKELQKAIVTSQTRHSFESIRLKELQCFCEVRLDAFRDVCSMVRPPAS
jgi:hypothetical protein